MTRAQPGPRTVSGTGASGIPVRIAAGVVYAGIAFGGVSAMAGQFRLALGALVHPYSYVPDLTAPWLWLSLGLAMGVALAETLRRMAAGRRVGMPRYATVLLLVGIVMFARKNVPVPARPTIDDGAAHLVARVELAADAAYDETKHYSDDVARLTAQWPDVLRDLGFYRRGARPLRSRLFVAHDSDGPALRAPEGAGPGDVVLVLSRDLQSYWITVFRLEGGARLAPVVDDRGRALVATASHGRAASRLDPQFPEYPNKSSGAGGPF